MTFDEVTIVQSRSVASRKYAGMCGDRGGFSRRTDDTAKWRKLTRSRRGLSLIGISRTQNPAIYVRVEYSNISYVETRSFPLWDFKQFYRETISSPVHKSMSDCRKIHRNNAIRSTDVRAKSRTDPESPSDKRHTSKRRCRRYREDQEDTFSREYSKLPRVKVRNFVAVNVMRDGSPMRDEGREKPGALNVRTRSWARARVTSYRS